MSLLRSSISEVITIYKHNAPNGAKQFTPVTRCCTEWCREFPPDTDSMPFPRRVKGYYIYNYPYFARPGRALLPHAGPVLLRRSGFPRPYRGRLKGGIFFNFCYYENGFRPSLRYYATLKRQVVIRRGEVKPFTKWCRSFLPTRSN